MIGSHLARRVKNSKKGFGETVAEVMDAEVDGEDDIHPFKRKRVAERVASPEVEPQSLDFDVNEFLQSESYCCFSFRGL